MYGPHWRTEPMEPAPELYHGPLPSLEAKSYIRKLEREHIEWVNRREQMKADHHETVELEQQHGQDSKKTTGKTEQSP